MREELGTGNVVSVWWKSWQDFVGGTMPDGAHELKLNVSPTKPRSTASQSTTTAPYWPSYAASERELKNVDSPSMLSSSCMSQSSGLRRGRIGERMRRNDVLEGPRSQKCSEVLLPVGDLIPGEGLRLALVFDLELCPGFWLCTFPSCFGFGRGSSRCLWSLAAPASRGIAIVGIVLV